MTTHYFSPGPAKLPAEVLANIHNNMLDPFGIGVSILEISHRSSFYGELNAQTLQRIRRVFNIPATHEILMSTVGAQHHFGLLVPHLSAVGDAVAYTNTGVWAHFAYQEAIVMQRKVNLIYDGSLLPVAYQNLGSYQDWVVPPESKYLHLTVNNTVYGTEYAKIPTFGEMPLVLDLTSALGARQDIPWHQTALIYASAQKNFGIAGVSVVIMRKDMLEKSRGLARRDHVPRALSYAEIADAVSILNTPPAFAVFCMNHMLQWMEQQGGVSALESVAIQKSRLLYDVIDQRPDVYRGRVDKKEQRSRHNVVFSLATPELDADFIQKAAQHNLLEIKGYKSIGGIRISLYTGVSLESAQVMADFMRHYSPR